MPMTDDEIVNAVKQAYTTLSAKPIREGYLGCDGDDVTHYCPLAALTVAANPHLFQGTRSDQIYHHLFEAMDVVIDELLGRARLSGFLCGFDWGTLPVDRFAMHAEDLAAQESGLTLGRRLRKELEDEYGTIVPKWRTAKNPQPPVESSEESDNG